MNKSTNNEPGVENVLATQSQKQQKQPESVSENEESDSVTDQSSSSTSETTNTQNSISNISNRKKKSTHTGSTKLSSTVTQFSVQRSDTDGLRMKISAIRSTSTAKPQSINNIHENTNAKKNSHYIVAGSNQDLSSEIGAKSKSLKGTLNESLNNNNNCEILPVKLGNIKTKQQPLQSLKISTVPTQRRQIATCADHQMSGNTVNKMSIDAELQNNSAHVSGGISVNTSTVLNSIAGSAVAVHPHTTATTSSIGLPLTNLLPQAPCLSDATAESGCSEATNPLTTETAEKSTRRIKVKRKKAQGKLIHESKRVALSAAAVKKSAQSRQGHKLLKYSSDSEDDVPIHNYQQQQQRRAPRLLLTAINPNPNGELQIKPLASSSIAAGATTGSASFGHGSDNIGISSSDNELKLDDVVNAAIKRVESDADDTPIGVEGFRKTRNKRLPQYQSTLLQDFMEKTQMLGSSTSATTVEHENADPAVPTPIKTKFATELLSNLHSTNSQSDSIASSGGVAVGSAKKRRGRPKKVPLAVTSATMLMEMVTGAPTSVITCTSTSIIPVASNINESADSGVISTTSTATTQCSASPSPKLSCATGSSNNSSITRLTATTPSQRRRHRTMETSNSVREPSVSPSKSQTQEGSGSCSTNSPKPKIDIAYLDKRMYAATERVLYPPPRNKRRQSISVANANVNTTPSSKNATKCAGGASTSSLAAIPTTAALAKESSKEELQLDPVWRKIDVNKKFRRPSVSGYKSDGGGGNTTICSKILAAKSGYVSDYGSFHARAPRDHSGYKSDASAKSRYSMKSCMSRRSRAKSCGYRSDYKDGKDGASLKTSKYRRKRRSALTRAHSKSVGNLMASMNDVEKDILQLAGLSLGQSSEESNEYVCKPNLESLPTTSASKKYGEINRFIATGEYFGRGSSSNSGLTGGANIFSNCLHDNADGSGSQDGYGFSRKLLLQRKHSSGVVGGNGNDLLLPHAHVARKIKSRRSSVASYCSSYYSSTSKVRKRRRRKSFLRFPNSSKGGSIIDSKLLTEIDILINTFEARCRIQSGIVGDKVCSSNTSSSKEKVFVEGGGKLQASSAPVSGGNSSKREQRDKRSLKKRKMSENHEHILLSTGMVGGSGGACVSGAPLSGGGSGGAKRRHKKTNSSSSPDDHKLPLKKRHYLLTPGEKSTEAAAAAAAAVAAKLFGSTAAEAWAAAAAAVASTKSVSATKAQHNQQQFGAIGGNTSSLSISGGTSNSSTKSSKTGLTPKKRHLLQQEEGVNSAPKSGSNNNNSSPLRITIDNSLNHKLLDISPISFTSSTKQSDAVHRKRSRLEVLVSKIVATTNSSQGHVDEKESPPPLLTKQKQIASATSINISQQSADTPPPGVFEPSVALEIQIPPVGRLSDTIGVSGAVPIITKAEVNSPLILQDVPLPTTTGSTTKTESTTMRVVETLLNKTGATNSLLKRKRKKINRTGFPNVRRRKKRKMSQPLLLDVVEEESDRPLPLKRRPRGRAKIAPQATAALVINEIIEPATSASTCVLAKPERPCDRVPVVGEASDSFLERANRTPRLSVVALERLRGTPTITATGVTLPTVEVVDKRRDNSFVPRKGRTGRKAKTSLEVSNVIPEFAKREAANKMEGTVHKHSDTTALSARQTRVSAVPTTRTATTEKNACNATAKSTAVAASKSAKRTKVAPTDETVLITPSLTKNGQPFTAANNALTRARGRKPKLAPVNFSSEPALFTPDINKKRVKACMPATGKDLLLTPKKQIRKALATTSAPPSPLKTPDRPASFSKSTVHKIITAKSLEAKVKLPAGIDPNTNFSCKIRLKRRSTVQLPLPSALRQSIDSNVGGSSSIKDTPQPTPEEIDAEAAAKDSSIEYTEHDVLPRSDTPFLDSEAASTSDTSDEKCSTVTNATSASSISGSTVRKVARLKKNYLPAGLFSDYFKGLQTSLGSKKSVEKKDPVSTISMTTVSETSTSNTDCGNNASSMPVQPFLPPPPYCEQYFRRTQHEFQLPYDIWWAYTNSKLPTRITVPSWNYRKIRTNIYADAVRPNTAGLDHPTCNCKPEQACGDNCLNRMVYTECSPSSCPAHEKCRNQKIQRHEVAPGVERFMTTDKGWGVRTKLPIIKGTYILEYVGEVVTEREFKDRMGTIYLNDTHHYCLHLDGGLVIDGHRMGSDGRFVNHSCQPNCEMQKWSVNGLSRMALFAKRNIEAGEELSYDYNFSLFNPSEGQPCRCNTPQCRGVIGGKSQRIKPLPIEPKATEPAQKDSRNGRQRKRKACKNTERVLSKDVVVARVQQLSDKEKKFVKQHGVFLVRNFEKIRRCKARCSTNANGEMKVNGIINIPITSPNVGVATSNPTSVGAITSRRPSTPASLAAQISALCSPRSIKTRGLTLAVQDPEVEKMAKIAVILRDICVALESLKDPNNEQQTLAASALTNGTSVECIGDCDTSISNLNGTNKKKRALKAVKKQKPMDLKTVQINIEQGYYKQATEFDTDMQKVFAGAQQQMKRTSQQRAALKKLITAYELKKRECYAQLLELVAGDESALGGFCAQIDNSLAEQDVAKEPNIESYIAAAPKQTTSIVAANSTSNEDIIRCICGLYKDEGLMIQCARCMVWQHTECTKADVNADNYLCERCQPRIVDREIPLEDFTEEGHRYYLTLMRGELHVRQGDAVYVLRDIPIKDSAGNVVPTQKHTYETIGTIDYNECDIFRVERLWKNEEGKRFIFGHHFLRPHETFHEPSRRFYPNEVVRVPLYEIVPIELVIGRCWVLDRTTFCKGRPVECVDEAHCYICELRVDKTARFFSKAKVNYPTCTKTYAFRKFLEKLKISKSYAPHDVDPALLKTKRQKTDIETVTTTKAATIRSMTPVATGAPLTPANMVTSKPSPNKISQNVGRKCYSSSSPATVHLISPIPPSMQTIKRKRMHLESVLKTMKLKWKNTQTAANGQPIDLSYLLSGRGARQRKTQATAVTAATAVSNNLTLNNSQTKTSSSTANVPT